MRPRVIPGNIDGPRGMFVQQCFQEFRDLLAALVEVSVEQAELRQRRLPNQFRLAELDQVPLARIRLAGVRDAQFHCVLAAQRRGQRLKVIAEAAPNAMAAILSGPSFADDVARGLPTAVTLAAKDEALAAALVQALGSSTFRPYHTTDVRGVEIGGAAKNVLAIAAGIAVGRKLGASAQAALTTRSFSELARLGRACGARAETLVGLSGLGDLILTCSSPQSRNFALGVALGRGEPPPSGKLAEGQFTAPVLVELAASQGVDMPVSNAVAAILSGKITIDAAIEGLLTRPFKAEE